MIDLVDKARKDILKDSYRMEKMGRVNCTDSNC